MTRTAATALVFALVAGLASIAPATAGDPASPKTVVELFTSQGCSSCPPADKLLGRLAERDDVIALSFNVDYWDYLGWKDTLARPAHTKRQYAYARARGDGKVYTPQAIVNGLQHVVGSRHEKIEKAAAATGKQRADARVSLALSTTDTGFVIEVDGEAPAGKPATVFIAAVRPAVKVKIKRGENHGQRITYHNVVRNMAPVAMWSGGPKRIVLRRNDIVEKPDERCVVLVQAAGPGAILAADWMPARQ